MKPKSVVFMGTAEFSGVVLKKLIDNDQYNIIGILTQPDKRIGRKRELQETEVKRIGINNNIPIYQPEHLSKSDELDTLIGLEPDLIITAAYGQFLPTKLLDAAKIKAINVHGSLLPKYRGGAPIQHAILNGDSETGITIMEMVKKMDAGKMYAKQSVKIEDNDDTGSMFKKLSIVGANLLIDTLPGIIDGGNVGIDQKESEATFSPNISAEQEKIDFSSGGQNILNQIRALSPKIGGYFEYLGQRNKIFKAQLVEIKGDDSVPGTVLQNKKRLIVKTGDDYALEIVEIQPSGKGKMNIKDFLNGKGRNLKIGEQIGD